MFGSRSITMHLIRGVVGIGMLAMAMSWRDAHPWALLAAIPVALIALGGCPMCWLVGLGVTVANRRGVCSTKWFG